MSRSTRCAALIAAALVVVAAVFRARRREVWHTLVDRNGIEGP